MFTVLGASWSQPGVKRHCQPGRVAGVRGPLSRRRVGRPRPLPCLSCQPFLGGRWPHWTDREDGVVGGPTTLQTWCNPHSTGVTPGRPTMARQDLPPLECRGKGGLDQPSGKGERGGRGQLLASGWEAEGTWWRGVCNVSQIFYYRIPSVDQLVCVCATCQLLPTTEHNACTTFLFRLLPPALTVPQTLSTLYFYSPPSEYAPRTR